MRFIALIFLALISCALSPSYAVVALDATAYATATSDNVSSQAITINTTSSAGTYVLWIYSNGPSGTAAPIVSTVSGSLSPTVWTKRSATTAALTSAFGNGTANVSIEIWYANFSAQIVTDIITVTWGSSVDNEYIIGKGFTGTNAIPWDSGSYPFTSNHASNSPTSIPSVGTVSTTNANTLVFEVWMNAENNLISGTNPGTGYTAFLSANQISQHNGVYDLEGDMEYQIFSTSQSNITVTWAAGEAAKGWLAVVDALTSDPPASGGAPPSLSLLGAGK